MAADIIPFERRAQSFDEARTGRLFQRLSDALRARPEGHVIAGSTFHEILSNLNEALENER
jgi:hypothetical protein